MSEREYYEQINELSHGGNCERCSYNFYGDGGCQCECMKSYEQYKKEELEYLKEIGLA